MGTFVFSLLNAHREQNRVQPLRLNPALQVAAQKHSQWMARTKRLSHESLLPGMKEIYNRVEAEGYNWSSIAETIISVSLTSSNSYSALAQTIVDNWTRDSNYDSILLDQEAVDLGIGVALSSDSLVYVTVDFGRPMR
jgi:uncharacterized protein YkwD